MHPAAGRSAARIAAILLVVALAAVVFIPTTGGFAQEGGTVNMQPATPTALGPPVPPEVSQHANDWPLPTGDYAAHRAASNSPISTSTVSQLKPAWTFEIPATGPFGAMTAVPLVVGDTLYVQDMKSNVYALDRATGKVKWAKTYDVPTEGPNGVAIGYGMLFGSLGNTAELFALDAADGHEIWRIKLSNNDQIGIDMAPIVYDNVVYVSTVPGNSANFYQGGQRGILYAIDARTGSELWEFDTTTDNLWGKARINSGGGLWYPPSIDQQGNLYFGVGNPAPWPGVVIDGTPWPNGSSRPGDNLYTNSMVSLDPRDGSVRWHQDVKPHDLFDLDFQLTPILANVDIGGAETPLAIGAGKLGRVVAVNADTGNVVWDTKVGTHQNDDLQAIPPGKSVEVYPGPLGGVETPMAYANGVVYAPVVNLSINYTSTSSDISHFDYGKATGELVAIDAADGSIKWDAKMPTMTLGGAVVANDVVFTAGLDGVVRGFDVADGKQVWSYQAQAGINAPLAVAGDMLFVPAGGFLFPPANQASVPATPGSAAGAQPAATPPPTPRNELIAFKLGASGAPAVSTVPAGMAAAAGAPATPSAPAQPAPASPAAQGGHGVTIDMVDIAFKPNAATIPANADVTITLPNQGSTVHNFNIDQLNVHSGNVEPGKTATVKIKAPAGTYQFYCDIPGHKEAGMVGTLTVK